MQRFGWDPTSEQGRHPERLCELSGRRLAMYDTQEQPTSNEIRESKDVILALFESFGAMSVSWCHPADRGPVKKKTFWMFLT